MIVRRISTHASAVCTRYKLLESSILDILSLVNPVEGDRVKRVNVINDFTALVQSMDSLRGSTVKPFGSFVSNLYTRSGDLDLSIELSHPPNFSIERSSKLFLLLDIMKTLQKTGEGRNFRILPLAKVPLLIFESSSERMICDVTVDNPMAILKTNLIRQISEMDLRFRDLVLLIKEWAKVHDINNAKQRTLSSLSIYLLVIFHFQTCEPAILPPLKDFYAGDVVSDVTGLGLTERYIENAFAANIAKFKSKNESSLYQLLISFFEKFSNIGSMSSQYVLSTYTGQWENIISKTRWLESFPFDKLIIEDPFKQSENASCAVGARELVRISKAFLETHQRLSSSAVLSDRDSLLASLARPDLFSQHRVYASQFNSSAI